MKLRIKQPGFDKYTGQLGAVSFKDGLSVGDVSMVDALRVSAVWLTEWENGETANIGQMILNNLNTPANVGMPVQVRVPQSLAPETSSQRDTAGAEDSASVPTNGRVWTREQLEAIADTKGIQGLREIAAPLGVKATSIVVLIDNILRAQPTREESAEGAEQEIAAESLPKE